jgi:hypothetical protein
MPSPVTLIIDLQFTPVCSIIGSNRNYIINIMLIYNVSLNVSLLILSILNRNVLPEYSNTSSNILYIVAEGLAMFSLQDFFFSSSVTESSMRLQIPCMGLFSVLSAVWIAGPAIYPVMVKSSNKIKELSWQLSLDTKTSIRRHTLKMIRTNSTSSRKQNAKKALMDILENENSTVRGIENNKTFISERARRMSSPLRYPEQNIELQKRPNSMNENEAFKRISNPNHIDDSKGDILSMDFSVIEIQTFTIS